MFRPKLRPYRQSYCTSCILISNGSIQCLLHSQWLSKNSLCSFLTTPFLSRKASPHLLMIRPKLRPYRQSYCTSCILISNGSIQCLLHSQWLSKNSLCSFLTTPFLSRKASPHLLMFRPKLRPYRQSYCTSCILISNGSIQCLLHSQWLSKNVSTSPLARSAPFTRLRIKPSKRNTFKCLENSSD